MKNKFAHQVYRLSATILISLIMVILGGNATTNAQNTVNVINGLFTPTKAQRFFNEGRRNFDLQVEILNDPDYYFNQQIPQFDQRLLHKTVENSPLNPVPETNPNHNLLPKREIPPVERDAP